MKRAIAWVLTMGMLLMAASCASSRPVSVTVEETGKPLVIVDPGHGGVDGGAVGSAGTIEKEVNLQISLTLRDFLLLMGYDVIMTRETDISIHDPEATTIRQMKTSDLHNRLKLATEHPNSVFLSIHQNQYSQASQHGMMLYYSPNHTGSKLLAEVIQENLRSFLQPQNTRELKEAQDNLFIMYNIASPAVLVECGFLSNPEEEAQLQQAPYQQQICLLLGYSLMESGVFNWRGN